MKSNREIRLKKAVHHISEIHPSVKKLILKIGKCRFSTVGTPYEVLVKSVIGQQLSNKAAKSLLHRVNIRIGGEVETTPIPEEFIKAGSSALRESGLSTAKSFTILSIAESYKSGIISDELLFSMPDEDVYHLLTSYKGIGPWTTEMVLMFALDRWDIFPTGDLGLRKSAESIFGVNRSDKSELEKLMKKFSPYRTILSWYLWSSLDEEPW